MHKKSSAKRYAQAIFEMASEKNEYESWQAGLEKLFALTSDKKLMMLLEHPGLPFSAKKYIVSERLAKSHPSVINLAFLLTKEGLLRQSRDLSQEYNDLLFAHRGMSRAMITTALPLDDRSNDLLSQSLEKMIHRKIVMKARVDSSIIGGFIARAGDTLIDGSVHQKLESLKKRLVAGNR